MLAAAGKGERPPKEKVMAEQTVDTSVLKEDKLGKCLTLSQEASLRHPRVGRKLVVC